MSLTAPGDASYHAQWLRVLDKSLRLALVLGLLATVLQSTTALSQIGPGASLTVVRGAVSVTRPDGTAIFPAGTGLTLAIGDIVGTLAQTRAIVTFFSGSEVELGSNTTIVIRRLDRDLLDQANVSVEHVSGSTLIRVPPGATFNPGIRVLGNDTVAVVKGGEIGHGVDPTSNNVTVACVDGPFRCGRDSVTFPNEQSFVVGQSALVVTGTGDLVPIRVARDSSVWDVLSEGASVGQPDGTTGPLGPRGSDRGRSTARDEDDDKPNQTSAASGPAHQTETPTPTATPALVPTATFTPTTVVPPGTPGAACGAPQGAAGSTGTFTFVHNLGRTSGSIRIDWNAFTVPDQFEIFYQGVRIFTTGRQVTGTGTATVPYRGASTFASVVVTTANTSTQWTYTITCLP